jgi:hypothetical protein
MNLLCVSVVRLSHITSPISFELRQDQSIPPVSAPVSITLLALVYDLLTFFVQKAMIPPTRSDKEAPSP